jgi:heat shock protein HslJ
MPGEREAYLLLMDGLATGSSGCNKLMGPYTLGAAGVLRFGALASTRIACPPGLAAQEAALNDAFARTNAYRIEGETLSLLDGEQLLARFIARRRD